MNIAMLVSGGVDSSVALKLLKDEGHTITAFYLKIWLEDETAFLGECPWEEDLGYVRAVCEQLNVPLEVVPLQKEYHERVISYALAEVRAGRTPNPDVMCNSFIKFGAFLDYIDGSGRIFDKVTTGHYACLRQAMQNEKLKMKNAEGITENGKQRTENEDAKRKPQDASFKIRETRYELLASRDSVKDQTYFLSRLTQEQLGRALFPLGPYTKKEVRAMAKRWNLPTKDRPDSQGLCFLGKINYRDFVKHHLGEREGDIVNADTGEVVAKHTGHWFYTIGQRHGLDLSGGPWYVTGKDIEKNSVYISHRLKMTTIERDTFEVGDFQWLERIENGKYKIENRHVSPSFIPPARGGMASPRAKGVGEGGVQIPNLFVKIRHGAQKYRCEVEFLDDQKSRLRVKLLEDKERGIAPGQFSVLYEGDVCLGSGIID